MYTQLIKFVIATVLMKDFPSLLLGTIVHFAPLKGAKLLYFQTFLQRCHYSSARPAFSFFLRLDLFRWFPLSLVFWNSRIMTLGLKEMAIKTCKKLPYTEFHHPSMKAATNYLLSLKCKTNKKNLLFCLTNFSKSKDIQFTMMNDKKELDKLETETKMMQQKIWGLSCSIMCMCPPFECVDELHFFLSLHSNGIPAEGTLQTRRQQHIFIVYYLFRFHTAVSSVPGLHTK